MALSFEFCAGCPLCECELVEQFRRFQETHPEFQEQEIERISQTHPHIDAPLVTETDDREDVERTIVLPGTPLEDLIDPNSLPISYGLQQEEQHKRCPIRRYIDPRNCGNKWVADGIGDDYKVDVDPEGMIIEKETCVYNSWAPWRPVFISAQTGRGKNTFVEEKLIPYVRDLSRRKRRSYKVLILSNRAALKKQIENRLNGNDDPETGIYSYGEYADVMTYQRLLHNSKRLETPKKNPPKYLYVVCDEAHFFTSDALFNPYTKMILSRIRQLFEKSSIRIYMSATPYDCLEYIDQAETCAPLFYHFKRDYSYLDIKAYSSINDLYDLIVRSVKNADGNCKQSGKWLIFIDDRHKCERVKHELEEHGKSIGLPLSTSMVYAVSADSKSEPAYMKMVKEGKLGKDTYVLITTSVLDNGVNLDGIKNVVVSDMSQVKCLQMVGRARVSGPNDRKTLYLQRTKSDDVKKKIDAFKNQQDAYHEWQLAFESLDSSAFPKDLFLEKYFVNSTDRELIATRHQFGLLTTLIEPDLSHFSSTSPRIFPNEIAISLLEKLVPEYEAVYNEICEEKKLRAESKGTGEGGKIIPGQRYLEYQFSWFGKEYSADNETYSDKEKAKKKLIDFLESYAVSGEQVDVQQFQKAFRPLWDAAFEMLEKDKSRKYGFKKINDALADKRLGYKLEGSHQIGPWQVVKVPIE